MPRKWQVDILVEAPFQRGLRELGGRAWLRKVVAETLSGEMPPVVGRKGGGLEKGEFEKGEVGLVIAGEERVRELNRNYRGLDEATDVLSFPFFKFPTSTPHPRGGGLEKAAFNFVTPPDGVLHLGEVIVCYPQAARQAQEQGHSLGRELALLVIHGVLHLLGYDHEEPEQEREMRAREEAALGGLGLR